MRHIVKPGNIYKVVLENGVVRFFQFIGKDRTELNSDVIKIFARHYNSSDNPNVETILHDDTECYMHTIVKVGIKLGYWEKFCSAKAIIEAPIFFRTSQDVGLFPKQHFISHRWVVWEMNGEWCEVGDLPVSHYKTDLGTVFAPFGVIYRLQTGENPIRYYPSYE